MAVVAPVPITVATVWGVFSVLDDPSPSGSGPVEVSRWVRLAIVILILGAGAAAIALAARREHRDRIRRVCPIPLRRIDQPSRMTRASMTTYDAWS